jgi:hypothetical protein
MGHSTAAKTPLPTVARILMEVDILRLCQHYLLSHRGSSELIPAVVWVLLGTKPCSDVDAGEHDLATNETPGSPTLARGDELAIEPARSQYTACCLLRS